MSRMRCGYTTDYAGRRAKFDLERKQAQEERDEALSLIKICLLMSKANRDSIQNEEFYKILKDFFKLTPEDIVPELIKKEFFKQKGQTLILLKEKNELQEMEKEQYHNCSAKIEKQSDFWLGQGLDVFMYDYCSYEARNEVQNNKFEYIGREIDEKTIVGIGPKAITLKDKNEEKHFHGFYLTSKRHWGTNTKPDGHEMAKRIIKKYGDLENNYHLKYITKDVED